MMALYLKVLIIGYAIMLLIGFTGWATEHKPWNKHLMKFAIGAGSLWVALMVVLAVFLVRAAIAGTL